MIKMQEIMGQAVQTAIETQHAEELSPAVQSREVQFFTAPKAVIKKTQLSITAFQLITSAAVCLLLKACQLFSPQLFDNLRIYLEHLFTW